MRKVRCTLIFRVLDDPVNGCNSFLVGDELSGKAAVVDPLEAIGKDKYLMEAQNWGLKIQYTIETHIHADHVSIGLELSEKLGIPRYMGHAKDVLSSFETALDQQSISLGTVELKFINTPGHTPESISILITDSLRAKEPQILLSGDSLFVGDVGRPDLAIGGGINIEEATGDLYTSLQKIKELPDYVELFPSHYGASKCGSIFMSKRQSSTIGYEKNFNRFLKAKTPEEFFKMQRGLIGPPPENSKVIRGKNIS